MDAIRIFNHLPHVPRVRTENQCMFNAFRTCTKITQLRIRNLAACKLNTRRKTVLNKTPQSDLHFVRSLHLPEDFQNFTSSDLSELSMLAMRQQKLIWPSHIVSRSYRIFTKTSKWPASKIIPTMSANRDGVVTTGNLSSWSVTFVCSLALKERRFHSPSLARLS